jgi:hypothetical protein
MGRAKASCEVITMIRVLHPEVKGKDVKQKLIDLEEQVCSTGVGDQGSGAGDQ